MKYSDLLLEIQRLLNWKGKPKCFEDKNFLYCWCGKCKQKDYPLPDDFQRIVAITAAKNYKKIMKLD